jgi:hypothetical protein
MRRRSCGFPVLDALKRARICGDPATTTRMIGGFELALCALCAAAEDAPGDGPKARRLAPAPTAEKPAKRRRTRKGDDRLDFTDPAALRAWLVEVRVAVDDANGVALDLLQKPRRRALGHREHARLHREAREKLAALLDFADPPQGGGPESEGEAYDPSGVASPIH